MTGLGADIDDDDEGRAVRFWWREHAVAMRSRSVLNAVDWEGDNSGRAGGMQDRASVRTFDVASPYSRQQHLQKSQAICSKRIKYTQIMPIIPVLHEPVIRGAVRFLLSRRGNGDSVWKICSIPWQARVLTRFMLFVVGVKTRGPAAHASVRNSQVVQRNDSPSQVYRTRTIPTR